MWIFEPRLEIIPQVHFFSIDVVFVMNIVATIFVLVIILHFHFTVVVHLHDLFEYFGGMDTHLLSDLKDLRVELLEVNVVQVDFLVIIFLMLLMVI